MKNLRQMLGLIIMMIFGAINVQAQDEVIYDGLRYQTRLEGKDKVTCYQVNGVEEGNTTEELNIPDEIDGIKVTRITANAFKNNKNIKKVNFGANINTAGWGCFEGCSNLEYVYIQEGVNLIEGRAFFDCAKLEAINLPSTLTTLGEYAYKGCDAVTRVIIPMSVKTLTGGSQFNHCDNLSNVIFEAG